MFKSLVSTLRGVSLAATAILFVGTLLASPAVAADWEYREDLGGWLDWDTGLVWGEHSAIVKGGSWSYDAANKKYLPAYRAATGIAAWRLPTKTEIENAAANGAAAYILPPPPQHTLFWNCWTSTTRGKTAYVGSILTGRGAYYSTSTYTNIIPVYRAFVP